MLEGEDDPVLAEELDENLKSSGKSLEELEEKAMLGQEYDSYPAVVTIHPGAGGTESIISLSSVISCVVFWAFSWSSQNPGTVVRVCSFSSWLDFLSISKTVPQVDQFF